MKSSLLIGCRNTAVLLILGVIILSSSARAAVNARLTTYSQSIFSKRSLLLAAEDKISAEVLTDLARGDRPSVVILMADQADLTHAYEIADHDARGWFVYRTLVDHANVSQKSLVDNLRSKNVPFQPFWVANMIVAEVDAVLAVEIAGRSDVVRVDSNKPTRWIETPEEAKGSRSASRSDSPETIEWGVNNVNAPAVWALGFNGTGIVVGGLDTGIKWDHSAIKNKYRGWNGTSANHNYNWFDSIHTGGGSCGANTTAPCDDDGHGSHTVGTMVGDDGTGNQVGVAPGAKWIGCRNMNQGDGTPATYSECFQFMIAPTDLSGNNPNPSLRPHVLNNSWGCPASEGCTTRGELETIVNNTQAAGIFVQASAGNGGNTCSTVSQALAIYDASFSAGAINISNRMAGFSSYGPSTFYDPNILKPNIVAPGESVRSISRLSDTAYTFSSGTSMASPHVAGVIALLWSARPQLARNIGATKTLLQNTANPSVSLTAQTCGGIPSTQIPNNSFGYGRVDALAAVTAVNVTGRVLAPEGGGIRNAVVSIISAGGLRRTATTSSFGIFSFEGVRPNESYTLTVPSKRYRFAPKPISVAATDLAAGDITGLQ